MADLRALLAGRARVDVLRPAGAGVVRLERAEGDEEVLSAKSWPRLAAALADVPELLVLDEACAACKNDLVEEALLREAAARAEQGAEVVLTGREPAAWMQDAADYSTELRAVKHPYTRGIAAREGVEY